MPSFSARSIASRCCVRVVVAGFLIVCPTIGSRAGPHASVAAIRELADAIVLACAGNAGPVLAVVALRRGKRISVPHCRCRLVPCAIPGELVPLSHVAARRPNCTTLSASFKIILCFLSNHVWKSPLFRPLANSLPYRRAGVSASAYIARHVRCPGAPETGPRASCVVTTVTGSSAIRCGSRSRAVNPARCRNGA